MSNIDIDLSPGTKLGNYLIERELGRGGMGIVYKAHEESLQRVVALKILSPTLVRDPAYAQRFLREARAGARLHHPNIVPVHAVGEIDGHHYISMAYVKGAPLSAAMRQKGQLPVNKAIDIARQIADALSAAHAQGIVHRDIKPDNIMLDQAGRIQVMDFGLARVLSARTQLTGDHSILGTPSYMSPEQCNGSAVDGRSDLYSLGVVLYEMLAGAKPFQGDSPIAIMYQIQRDPPPPLEELNTSVPSEVVKVVECLMAKSPDKRFPDAKQLIIVLTRLQGWQRDSTPKTQSKNASRPQSPKPPVSRAPKKSVALAVGAIALVFVFGMLAKQVLDDRAQNQSIAADTLEPIPVASTESESLTALPYPTERTVTFPDEAIGVYGLRDWGSDEWDFKSFHPIGNGSRGEPAVDTVTVPAGKELGISVNGDQVSDLRFLDELDPNDLQGFSFTNYQLQPGDLERIARFRSMRFLNLSRAQVPIDEYKHLEKLPYLKVLILRGAKITDDALKPLLNMPELIALNVEDTKMGDGAMEHLANTTNLQYLNIRSCNVTDRGIQHIENNSQLRFAELFQNDLSDVGMGVFEGMNNLEVLDLSHSRRVTDRGLDPIANLPNLRRLKLDFSKVTDTGLAKLTGLSLTHLSIGHNARGRITDAAIDHIVEMKSLQELGIQDTRITPAGLGRLATHPRLGLVALLGTDFKPGTADALAKWLNLRGLLIHWGPRPTLETAHELSKLKHLRHLDISVTNIDDAYVEPLSKLTHLGGLVIRSTKITPEGAQELRRLMPNTNVQY
jgi:serine/threonine protein kinase